MSTITSVKAIQVLDSRGLPTVSCSIKLSDGSYASAIVPSLSLIHISEPTRPY